MTTGETVVASLIWAWIALAVVPLALLWIRYVRHKDGDMNRIAVLVLIVMTLSYAWFLGIGLLPDIFGPHFTPLRYVSIYLNLLVGIVSIGLSAIYKTESALIIVITAWIFFLWLYLLFISSIV